MLLPHDDEIKPLAYLVPAESYPIISHFHIQVRGKETTPQGQVTGRESAESAREQAVPTAREPHARETKQAAFRAPCLTNVLKFFFVEKNYVSYSSLLK